MADPPAAHSMQDCAPSQQKRKRTAITLEVKKSILKDHSNGQKVSALVVKYGLSQSTVSTIIRSATKVTESGCSGMDAKDLPLSYVEHLDALEKDVRQLRVKQSKLTDYGFSANK